jgi:hypothetical protein
MSGVRVSSETIQIPLKFGFKVSVNDDTFMGYTNLTIRISRHGIGLLRYPWRNIRKRRNGRDTSFERKTFPMKAGKFAKAYRTYLMTKS